MKLASGGERMVESAGEGKDTEAYAQQQLSAGLCMPGITRESTESQDNDRTSRTKRFRTSSSTVDFELVVHSPGPHGVEKIRQCSFYLSKIADSVTLVSIPSSISFLSGF
jgi:hypothetical protein